MERQMPTRRFSHGLRSLFLSRSFYQRELQGTSFCIQPTHYLVEDLLSIAFY